MKDQMQYIVIEGRKPQDGAKPTQALLILPKWISPTLACAGVVGRVIELTDGNVIEQGLLPSGEQDLLAEIRADMLENAESQQEPTAALPNVDPHVADNAYREGMQAARAGMRSSIVQFGAPESGLLNWLKCELEELAQFRKDRPETLAKLQAAEDNLDAWRDAAGAAGLGQECDATTGQIKRLFAAVEGGELMDQYQALQEDFKEAQGDIESLKAQLLDTDNALRLIRKTAKKALKGTL